MVRRMEKKASRGHGVAEQPRPIGGQRSMLRVLYADQRESFAKDPSGGEDQAASKTNPPVLKGFGVLSSRRAFVGPNPTSATAATRTTATGRMVTAIRC